MADPLKGKAVDTEFRQNQNVRFANVNAPPRTGVVMHSDAAGAGKLSSRGDAGPSGTKMSGPTGLRTSRRSRSRGRSSRPPAVRAQVSGPLPKKTWAAVARPVVKGFHLAFEPPVMVDDELVLTTTADIAEAAHPKWNECVVGYFVGKRLPFKLTEDYAKRLWGNQLSEVMANDDGFYFFRIPDMDFQRQVLDDGPIKVQRVPLVLQQWHQELELKREQHEALPVWIRLRNIPYNYWSAQGIEKIASMIGKPLYVDSQTEAMKFISFVRVCVELNARSPAPESIKVRIDGISRVVKVEYEWRPISCPVCGTFGHKCTPVEAAHVPGSPHSAAPCSEADGGWKSVGRKPTPDKSPARLSDVQRPSVDPVEVLNSPSSSDDMSDLGGLAIAMAENLIDDEVDPASVSPSAREKDDLSNSSLLGKSSEAVADTGDSPSVNTSFVLESIPLKTVTEAPPDVQASPVPELPLPAQAKDSSPAQTSNILPGASGGSPTQITNTKSPPKRRRRGRRR